MNMFVSKMIFSVMFMFVTVQAAAVSQQDCGETFQSQMRELLAIKHTCDSAAFHDCCQVKIMDTYNTSRAVQRGCLSPLPPPLYTLLAIA